MHLIIPNFTTRSSQVLVVYLISTIIVLYGNHTSTWKPYVEQTANLALLGSVGTAEAFLKLFAHKFLQRIQRTLSRYLRARKGVGAALLPYSFSSYCRGSRLNSSSPEDSSSENSSEIERLGDRRRFAVYGAEFFQAEFFLFFLANHCRVHPRPYGRLVASRSALSLATRSAIACTSLTFLKCRPEPGSASIASGHSAEDRRRLRRGRWSSPGSERNGARICAAVSTIADDAVDFVTYAALFVDTIARLVLLHDNVVVDAANRQARVRRYRFCLEGDLAN